ncbi:hypothetical protein PMSD_25125 [Paenibacillus macquariensis subsp. defensor]|nr:hypothetical protein PMSD_25125 [Paenibacillus macquariensis subsp. defensor]
MDIKETIIEIIAKNSEMENVVEHLRNEGDLNEIGMNSISFIKMLVDIETAFDFEFDEEDLISNRFQSINDLISYLEKNNIGNHQ